VENATFNKERDGLLPLAVTDVQQLADRSEVQDELAVLIRELEGVEQQLAGGGLLQHFGRNAPIL
jgi:hypothetical protein